ncbi:MAG: alanine racemase, partial [Acetatifactor sp.]|nr:alanine racemase [Acetatifactor sp.]
MNEEIERKLKTYQRGYAEVDLDAIVDNMENMKQHLAPGTQMIGVIKADGYGHGSVPIAKCLQELDYVFGFAVATAEEAHILRLAGIHKPILLLGYAFPYSYSVLAEEEIRPAVFRYDMIEQLNETAAQTGKKIKVHIKVDTGMSRIGITPDEEGLKFVENLAKKEHLVIEGIFTHFARADEIDKSSAMHQLELFQKFVHMVETKLEIEIPMKHCANSASIMEL